MVAVEIETYCPTSRKQWRQWLQKNHTKKNSVWLIYYKKGTGKTGLTWNDAVEEALCFGWIDSKRKTLDEERFMQFFGRRKAQSTWSKINKAKVERLIVEGSMADAGLDSIEKAKKNGSWNLLDEVEELIISADLEKALNKKAGAKKKFTGLSRSERRRILLGLVMAKTDATRQKRIGEVLQFIAENHKK